MGKRKTAADYRKEYRNLQEKTNALEARIKSRAWDLVKQYPDVPYDTFNNEVVTVKIVLNINHFNTKDAYISFGLTSEALEIIEKIEKYNAEQSGIKQTIIYYPDDE